MKIVTGTASSHRTHNPELRIRIDSKNTIACRATKLRGSKHASKWQFQKILFTLQPPGELKGMCTSIPRKSRTGLSRRLLHIRIQEARKTNQQPIAYSQSTQITQSIRDNKRKSQMERKSRSKSQVKPAAQAVVHNKSTSGAPASPPTER
jgi:hypothetical protein